MVLASNRIGGAKGVKIKNAQELSEQKTKNKTGYWRDVMASCHETLLSKARRQG